MAAIRFGIIVLQPFRDRGEFGLRLLPRDARFEKSVTFNPARPAVFQFVAGESNVSCIDVGTQKLNEYPMKVPWNFSGATPMIVC